MTGTLQPCDQVGVLAAGFGLQLARQLLPFAEILVQRLLIGEIESDTAVYLLQRQGGETLGDAFGRETFAKTADDRVQRHPGPSHPENSFNPFDVVLCHRPSLIQFEKHLVCGCHEVRIAGNVVLTKGRALSEIDENLAPLRFRKRVEIFEQPPGLLMIPE